MAQTSIDECESRHLLSERLDCGPVSGQFIILALMLPTVGFGEGRAGARFY
jgi:hypothetical protein